MFFIAWMAKPARRMGTRRTFLSLSSKSEEKDDPPTSSRFCAGQLDSGEKKNSDVPYQEPESTKSSRQRVHTAQVCENTLRTGSAIPDNPGIRVVIPSTSVGWAFVTKESPSP